MKRFEVEAWAHRVIDQVVTGRPSEDDLVELKTDWPTEYQRAARRIAAHANSARQQAILWLIGVDEKGRRVPGASAAEVSDWVAAIRSELFRELGTPVLAVHNIPRGDDRSARYSSASNPLNRVGESAV